MRSKKRAKFSILQLFGLVLGIGVLVAIGTTSCEAIKSLQRVNDGPLTSRLRQFLAMRNLNAPESDATRDVDNEKADYLGLWNFGIEFPGIPQAEWQLVHSSGDYSMIPGITDLLESSDHEKLSNDAWEYAKRYNNMLYRLRTDNRAEGAEESSNGSSQNGDTERKRSRGSDPERAKGDILAL